MSWFQSLRDDFTLIPFETPSDSAAMASGPPDSTNQEPAEVQEDCSGKKKSKFQTFKKFFTRKKRKEPSTGGAEAGLKASQSSDNVSKTSENITLTRSEKDKGSGSKISLGSKALSHDSVFVSDSSEANEALGTSQDSIHGKVKSLQLQLKQAIKLGSPPSLMCVKKTDDTGAVSEDDGLPCSPPECSTPHTTKNRDHVKSSNSLLDNDDDQLSYAGSSRAVSPLVVPGDFSQPASPFSCLDNSAAKHKLGLRQKACNRRKPASRLEWKTEGGSTVEEMLTVSVPGAETDALKEQKQQKTEDANSDQFKPKMEREEKEDEEDEERGQTEDSTISLLRDEKEEEEEGEGEDESEAEQDVSHGPDPSCAMELSLSEEEGSDDQPLPSSSPSSRASPMNSPRATPEPSAGPREHLMGSPGISYKAADYHTESDSASVEDYVVQENKEQESSFLEEVLSSLKTPLVSSSLDMETEDIVVEMKEETEEGEEEEEEVAETEECVEVKGEESQACNRATSSCSVQSDQASEEEETVGPSMQEEEANAIEELERSREGQAENEEEDLVLEQCTEDSSLLRHEEEGRDDEPEVKSKDESNILTRPSPSQEREEGGEMHEGEVEAIELEKEPEVEEEGLEKREEDDDGEVEVQMNEPVEVEELMPSSQDEEIHNADEAKNFDNTNEEIPADVSDQVRVQEQEHFNQNYEDEREDEEEGAIEDDFIKQMSEEEKEKEEEMETSQPHVDEPEQDLEHGSDEMTSLLDLARIQKDPDEAAEQLTASSKPPPLHLSDSLFTHSQESTARHSSKTAIMHLNLASPSSEKDGSLFPQLPPAADPSKSVTESPSAVDPSSFTEQYQVSIEEHDEDHDEKHDDAVEVIEEKQPAQEQEESSPANVEDVVPQSPDQSKVRFTIAPAWQRSQNLPSPPPPPACISSPKEDEEEPETIKNHDTKPEPLSVTKPELVLSPGRGTNAGSTTVKPQSNATPTPGKPPAPASTVESSVIVEGNPNNPFGVRLRKTSALLRFSSEEESQEPSVESPTLPASCVVDTLQPVSSKPSICQPLSNKPALPKKPEVHGDAGVKPRCISEPAGSRGISGGSHSPSWISMAKQKQKIYKESSLDDINVKKEDQDRKSSLPTYVSSAASWEHSNKTVESPSSVGQLELSKPSVSVGKDSRRTLSPPTPVPPQPLKSQPLPCPIAPKPQLPPAKSKPPPQANPTQRSLSTPTPVPVPSKSLPCSSPPNLSKTATSPKTPPVTSPPFSSRTCPPEKVLSRAPELSGQAVSPQRSLSPPALSEDEPPWMALAKKKAKAWSEMPQIVQ